MERKGGLARGQAGSVSLRSWGVRLELREAGLKAWQGTHTRKCNKAIGAVLSV